MACPFFSPTERADDLALPHPSRLPLGSAWRGSCCAPGHELMQLALTELEACNLGYATTCARLPNDRTVDAVRFAVSKESPQRILLHFVLEAKHLPVAAGLLEYDRLAATWTLPHSEPRIQNLADCFLRSHLERGRP